MGKTERKLPLQPTYSLACHKEEAVNVCSGYTAPSPAAYTTGMAQNLLYM